MRMYNIHFKNKRLHKIKNGILSYVVKPSTEKEMEKIYVKVKFSCEDPNKIRTETMNALVFQASNSVKEAVYVVMASRDAFVKTVLINYESLVSVFAIENRTFLEQHKKNLADQFLKVSENWGSIGDKMTIDANFEIIEKNAPKDEDVEKKETKPAEIKPRFDFRDRFYHESEEGENVLRAYVTIVGM